MNVLHQSDGELSPRRQRSRERRTERIVSAAMELVATEAFDALTMTRLAGVLDLSVGALYRYFPSKDALVVELQARAIRTILSELQDAQQSWQLPRGGAGSCAAILGMAAFYLDLPRSEPRLYRLVAATLADPRQLVDDAEAARIVPEFATLLAEVARAFASAQDAGVLDEGKPLERTVVLWSALHGVTLVDKLGRLVPDDPAGFATREWFAARRLGLELSCTLLRGWGAKRTDVTRARAWLEQEQESE
jgi:AcrR family transcriptional regulator